MTGSNSKIVCNPHHQSIMVVHFGVAGQDTDTVINSQRICRSPSGLRLGLLCSMSVPTRRSFRFGPSSVGTVAQAQITTFGPERWVPVVLAGTQAAEA